MARFPSVKSLISDSLFTFKRFPFSLICAFIGTLASIYMYNLSYNQYTASKNTGYLIMVCSLGLTLFFAISLFSERKKITKGKFIAFNAIALALLTAYYFFLRSDFNNMELTRYILINIALHLSASFAGFTDKNNVRGFWQFNKALFLRLFFALIYSGTLYIGICLAMLAVDNLFNVYIGDKNYFRLWIIVMGVFNTWFFLSGVPENLEALEHSDDYPKGLKIFTQYVLLPLVTLYLLILYAYTCKIIFTRHLPKGWVSYLVIGFSVLGVLALLLVYPIRNREGNKWIHVFSKWFYGALYPLVVLLFAAIGTRIDEYGITEKRYFIIVLALWLTGISTYFLFGKKANIKYIPVTLCIIALVCSFGPWGAFRVSQKSQFKVLENVLVTNNILKSGKIDPKHAPVSDSVAEQITSIVRYFDDMHGFNEFKPWFAGNIDSLIADTLRYQRVDNVLKWMNVPATYNYYRREDGNGNRNFTYYATDQTVKEISGYAYECSFYNYGNIYNEQNKIYNKIDLDSLTINIGQDSCSLEIKTNRHVTCNIPLTGFLEQIAGKMNNYSDYRVPYEIMQKTYEDTTVRLKLNFKEISGKRKKDKFFIDNINGNCLIKFK